MADALCSGCENRANLETLLDDRPLLDESNAVFDSVDHHFGTDGHCPLAQRAGWNLKLPPEELVGYFASATGGNLLRNHRELTLDLIVLRGERACIAQGPLGEQRDHSGDGERTTPDSDQEGGPGRQSRAGDKGIASGSEAYGERSDRRQIEERGRRFRAVSPRVLHAVQHCEHREQQSTDERREKNDAQDCHSLAELSGLELMSTVLTIPDTF